MASLVRVLRLDGFFLDLGTALFASSGTRRLLPTALDVDAARFTKLALDARVTSLAEVTVLVELLLALT
jgi:hypothetical protein